MKRFAILSAVALTACGANQLKVAAAQAWDLAGKANVERIAINSICGSIESDEKAMLCIAAAEKYDELVHTLITLADAIQAAEGKEDPNVDNIVELAAKAVRLEYDLAKIIDALGDA